MAKVVSHAWKNLSDTERSYWLEIAQRDRERFEREKAVYTGPWKVPDVKDPHAPKKPMSAFLAFGNERRKTVAEANPSLSNTEISHVLSRLWRDCPPDIKQKYKDREAKERAEFKKVREAWEQQKEERFIQQNANAAKAPPAAFHTEQQADHLSLPDASKPLSNMPIMTMDGFAPSGHPFMPFSSGSAVANSIIQPLHPETSGMSAVNNTAAPSSVASSYMHQFSSCAFENNVISEESLDAYLSLDERSATSETEESWYEPTPVGRPMSHGMTREPALPHLREDTGMTIMMGVDMMEELEMLGQLEDEDDVNQRQYVPPQVPLAVPQQHVMYHADSQDKTMVRGASQEAQRLARLARELGDVGIDMLIGAFRR